MKRIGGAQNQYTVNLTVQTRDGVRVSRTVTLPARNRGEAAARARSAAVTPTSTVLDAVVL